MEFIDEVLEIMRKRVKGKVFGPEKSNLLALIGTLSKENQDFELIMEDIQRIRDPRDLYEFIPILAEAGKIEYARQIAGKIKNPFLMFKAYLYIGSRSIDGRDFQSAINIISTDYTLDDTDRETLTSDAIIALAKAKKYQWAYLMTRKARHPDAEIGQIADIALKAGDYSEAFRFAIEAREAKTAFDVANVFIQNEDIEKARHLTGMIRGICNANYYRAYAYLKIAMRTNKPEDFKEAVEAIRLSRKNDSKTFSSDIIMYYAILYRNKYLIGLACDEALKPSYKESTVNQLLANLKNFKQSVEKRKEQKTME